jgi:hypothetical protein
LSLRKAGRAHRSTREWLDASELKYTCPSKPRCSATTHACPGKMPWR